MARDYDPLRSLERHAFAWEWLRRHSGYQRAWQRRDSNPGACRKFGLVEFIEPELRAGIARPIWHREVDPFVLVAEALDRAPPPNDGLDLLDLVSVTSIAIGEDDCEHILLSDGRYALRLDIAAGSLIGAPALLAYHLTGQLSAAKPAWTLRQLTALTTRGARPRDPSPRTGPVDRWVLELRVADGLQAGASQREIAAHLFPKLMTPGPWRVANPTIRLRVQRVVRRARLRLELFDPSEWLDRPRG